MICEIYIFINMYIYNSSRRRTNWLSTTEIKEPSILSCYVVALDVSNILATPLMLHMSLSHEMSYVNNVIDTTDIWSYVSNASHTSYVTHVIVT